MRQFVEFTFCVLLYYNILFISTRLPSKNGNYFNAPNTYDALFREPLRPLARPDVACECAARLCNDQ